MWWLGTMESDTVSESLTDQVGGILKVRVTSIQKLDTGFSGGILKFQTLVSQWDTKKKCQFQTLWWCEILKIPEGRWVKSSGVRQNKITKGGRLSLGWSRKERIKEVRWADIGPVKPFQASNLGTKRAKPVWSWIITVFFRPSRPVCRAPRPHFHCAQLIFQRGHILESLTIQKV